LVCLTAEVGRKAGKAAGKDIEHQLQGDLFGHEDGCRDLDGFVGWHGLARGV
jgi:hypothetical protein